jgi:WD40 repeat protein
MTDDVRDGFRALLIVNWEFPADSSGKLSTLEGPRNDAQVLRAALIDKKFGAFAEQNVEVCRNKPVAGVLKAIGDFLDSAREDDTLLLYYSGHGQRDGSRLYLGAYDTDGAAVFATGLDTENISYVIRRRNRARKMIVVLDCCHAGAFDDKSGGGTLELPELELGEGQYLLASSRWFETSKDTAAVGLPSPFTSALCQALLDPDLSGGANGELTVQQVYDDLFERYRRHELKVGPQKKDQGRGGIAIAKRPRASRPRAKQYSRLIQTLVLEGTGDELFSVAISPDGKTVAAGTDRAVLLWSGDTEIWDWDRASPPEPVALRRRDSDHDLHDGYVYSVAFSPDGKMLASSDEEGCVRITGLDGEAVLDGKHQEAVYSVAFAQNGQLAVSGGWDHQVIVWDIENKTALRKFPPFPGRISCVAFSPDDQRRLFAVGSLDNSIRLQDVAGGSPRALNIDHASSVECVAFSFDGSLLASCGLDKSVRVWDVRNNRKLWAEDREHEYLVRSVAFAPDGETLASASWDKTMKLWNSYTGEVRDVPFHAGDEKHTDWIWAVTFSPDGNLLASAGSDNRIIIWSLPDARKHANADGSRRRNQ